MPLPASHLAPPPSTTARHPAFPAIPAVLRHSRAGGNPWRKAAAPIFGMDFRYREERCIKDVCVKYALGEARDIPA